MPERKPVSIAWIALIPLVIFACLLCGLFGLLGALAGSLSDPYSVVRTSLAENNQLTPFTAGPTTTPGPRFTNTPTPRPAIVSTAGKLPSHTPSATLPMPGPASQSETPTITAAFVGTPSLTTTPVRAGTATPTLTQTPTIDQSLSATITAIGNCDCKDNKESDPLELDCTTNSFNSREEAQACFDFCMWKTGKDVYRLDTNNDGTACENGLTTPSQTPTP